MKTIPLIVYANHADFKSMKSASISNQQSRMCLWTRSGRGDVIINGQKISMQANDYLYIPWGVRMRYLPDPKNPFFVSGIHLIPRYEIQEKIVYGLAHEASSKLFNSKYRCDEDLLNFEGVCHFTARPDSPLRQLSAYIVSHFQGGNKSFEQLQRLTLTLITELKNARENNEEYQQQTPNTLKKLLVYIDEHLSEDLSSNDCAKLMGCSSSQMRRQFQKYKNMTPVEWINLKRIEKSRDMLSSTRMSIAEISHELGYSDQFYFSRIFKKICGESPLAFRKASPFI
jgi:AraC family transcriptional regulator, arabinose operon regulatory protein